MLLIHTQNRTSRVDYAFKHICTRILGVKVQFTSIIEDFIAHQGPKISYGKQPIGSELFVQAQGLLTEQGIEDLDISVQPWGECIGFFAVGDKSALPFDIFSAAFYLLSRYEEYLPQRKDELGRYPAEESLGFQHQFLRQPVIDIWAFRFKEVLLVIFPNMKFQGRSYKLHHLVEATQPFAYAHRGFLRNFTGLFRDLGNFRFKKIGVRIRVLLKLRKDPFDVFTWMMNTAKKDGSRLTVFFLLGEGHSFREDTNSKREKYQQLVKYVGDYTEVGLTFSYHSLDDETRLKAEKMQMEEVTHRPLQSTRNDKFMVNLPHIYRSLLELEVARDMTMCYDEHLGFRAGTCTPFLFYDLDYEIKTPLIIHPVAGQASVLNAYSDGEIENEIYGLRDAVKAVNGTFSLLFSNRDLTAKNVFWRRFFTEN